MRNNINFINNILIITFLTLSFYQSCIANDEITIKLLQRIEKSTQELNTIQSNINKDSNLLNSQLNNQLTKAKSLRARASSLQRLADEQLISYESLKNRVDLWSAQSNYQKQLISSYLESSRLDFNLLNKLDGEPVIDINALNIISDDITHNLTPRWELKEVANNEGVIEHVNFLEIGPVNVAFSQNQLTGGPITFENPEQARILMGVFNDNDVTQLNNLKNNHFGTLTFDPTLGNAYKIMNQGNGLLDHLRKGGVWAIPIIFFGVFSLIVSIIKAFQLIKLPKINVQAADKLKALLHAENKVTTPEVKLLSNSIKGAQKGLLDIAMSTNISQERDDLLVAYLIEYKHKIERFLGAIATSAAIAPLLGLLGTVSGMISTFMMMKTFGTSDASTVSGGISEALITTELGLIVAIPSLIMSALLSRKTKSYSSKLEANAIKLSKINFT
jgi:biopolymer transport protein ExbB